MVVLRPAGQLGLKPYRLHAGSPRADRAGPPRLSGACPTSQPSLQRADTRSAARLNGYAARRDAARTRDLTTSPGLSPWFSAIL